MEIIRGTVQELREAGLLDNVQKQQMQLFNAEQPKEEEPAKGDIVHRTLVNALKFNNLDPTNKSVYNMVYKHIKPELSAARKNGSNIQLRQSYILRKLRELYLVA